MGTWGEGILQNDDALDIHSDYIEQYNSGLKPKEIRRYLEEKFPRDLGDPPILVDNVNFWLGLAHAQWECKALDADVLENVRTIVARDIDADYWTDGYDERKRVLVEFLEQIQTPPQRARRREKQKYFKAPFVKGDCLIFQYQDGAYGAAVCLTADRGLNKHASSLLAQLRIHQSKKPTLDELLSSHVLVLNYAKWDNVPAIDNFAISKGSISLKQVAEFSPIGQADVGKTFGKSLYGLGGNKSHLEVKFKHQSDWEAQHPECANLSFPIRDLIIKPEDGALTEIAEYFAASHQDIPFKEAKAMQIKAREIIIERGWKNDADMGTIKRYVARYCGISMKRAEDKVPFIFLTNSM